MNSANPWFIRGTNYINGTEAGVSAFSNNNGNANGNIGFRVPITTFKISLR